MALKAQLRTETGTSASRRARREGLVPVTLYGNKIEATSLLVNRREFEAILRKEGSNAVFVIEYDGKEQQVWIKDYDKAVLKDQFYNVDLEAISADQKLEVDIPLHLEGEENVKDGIVEIVEQTILVETTPANIPASFVVNVENLEIGDNLTVADLEVPEGVKVLLDDEQTIVTVSAPTEEPEEVDPDAEVAEPEVIGEADEEASEE